MKLNHSIEGESRQLRVRNAIANDVQRILNDSYEELREKIVTLFREGKRSIDIARDLVKEEIAAKSDVSEEIRASVIRGVLRVLIEPEERKRMSSQKHRKRMERGHETVDEGRVRWMKEQGMFVWSDEQKTYFEQLLTLPLYFKDEDRQTQKRGIRKRRLHYNHELLAKEMNNRFETNEFTAERTRRKLELLRQQERSQTLPDVSGEFDNTIAVAPLVVVPAEDL